MPATTICFNFMSERPFLFYPLFATMQEILHEKRNMWYTVAMAAIPQTSVSLLEALSGDATSVRWTEFVNKYSGPMRAFLQARYPAVEAEDVIQETFIALVKCLPRYRYVPDEHGYFHNYLIGIAKHKAEDACRRQAAHTALKSKLENEGDERTNSLRQADDGAEAAWRNAAKEAALEQLLADDSIALTTRLRVRGAGGVAMSRSRTTHRL